MEEAKANAFTVKQTFEKAGKHITNKASRYGRAKPYRRISKLIKRQGTIAGRLSREIARKANALSSTEQEALMHPFGGANRIRLQLKQGK